MNAARISGECDDCGSGRAARRGRDPITDTKSAARTWATDIHNALSQVSPILNHTTLAIKNGGLHRRTPPQAR